MELEDLGILTTEILETEEYTGDCDCDDCTDN